MKIRRSDCEGKTLRETMTHIVNMILLTEGEIMDKNGEQGHYVLGEWYNVGGMRRQLTSIGYCGAPNCAGRLPHNRLCRGAKKWTPDKIATSCGFLALVPDYPRWDESKHGKKKEKIESICPSCVDGRGLCGHWHEAKTKSGYVISCPHHSTTPRLLEFTELVAFELSAQKWEKLRDGASDSFIKDWLNNKAKKYDIGKLRSNYTGKETTFAGACPLCHYFDNNRNGGCDNCAKRCCNLNRTGDSNGDCFEVWKNYRTTLAGKTILATEFQRVADELAGKDGE